MLENLIHTNHSIKPYNCCEEGINFRRGHYLTYFPLHNRPR